MDQPTFLPRPGLDVVEQGRYDRDDYEIGDALDLITLLTWRFVRNPPEGDPPPDREGYPDLYLDDEMVEQWREWMMRNAHDERPIVTRREIIDPRATQVRTLAVSWPFSSGRHHTIGILKKIKWGTLVAQILSGALGGFGSGDLSATIKQITDLLGAFDATLTNLTHHEAAVLTVADGFKNAEWAPRWLWRCNDLLQSWSAPGKLMGMGESEFHDTLLALIDRGIEVELSDPKNFRNRSLLTHGESSGILQVKKVRIRPMVLLVNW
ncbi:hypothetical protein MJ547_04520, partial [Burkholderia gladioli]